MCQGGVLVYATQDDRNSNRLLRGQLAIAKVDLYKDILSIGRGTQRTIWKQVEVELDGKFNLSGAAKPPQSGSDLELNVELQQRFDKQQRFDNEKRRRMAAEPRDKHGYDDMTQWARQYLNVDTATAHELWVNRSREFPRTGGRPKSSGKYRQAPGNRVRDSS
jgi:hypothetical protein